MMAMTSNNQDSIEQAKKLSGLIRNDQKPYKKILTAYSYFSFALTKILERYIPQKPSSSTFDILNFGCGNIFYDDAVNSDLMVLHRYIRKSRTPDLFWSGTIELKNYEGHFRAIICEHVIEHILPDNVLVLFSNFYSALKKGGDIVITFPDIQRLQKCVTCQGFSSPIIAVNSAVYRFGHAFMYDVSLVEEMLQQVGFVDVRTVSFHDIPLNRYLHSERESESSYVIARKS